MTDTLFIVLIAIVTAYIFYKMFGSKKATLGDELVLYIQEKLREKGYTDLDLEDLVIKLEDQRHLMGFIYLSIYRYDGKFVEMKTDEIYPYEIWLIKCDELIESFLRIIGDSNV